MEEFKHHDHTNFLDRYNYFPITSIDFNLFTKHIKINNKYFYEN